MDSEKLMGLAAVVILCAVFTWGWIIFFYVRTEYRLELLLEGKRKKEARRAKRQTQA
jgi:hypothetical protein